MQFIKAKILYRPRKRFIMTDMDIQPRDIYVKNNKATIHGWLFQQRQQQQQSDKCKTVLISHGNAGNISNRGKIIKLLYDIGVNVVIYDYQGYGKSTGHPSEDNFYSDGEKMVEYLITDLGVPMDDIILFGESIGCGVASYLAQKYSCPKVILLSGFSSIRDMFHYILPYFSIFGCLITEFPVNRYISRYKGDVLLLHSRDDELIPYCQAVKNSQFSNCQLIDIEGTHNHPILDSDVIQYFLENTF